MVVLVIIGIMLTFVGLPVGGRSTDDRLEFEARRLDRTLRFALEEAEIKGLLIGFRYLPDRYEFLTPGKEGDWEPYTSGPFRVHPLARPFDIELRVEDRVVPPAQEAEKGKDGPELKPQILLLPSGEVSAFRMELGADGTRTRYTIEANALGQFQYRRVDGERK